MNLIPRIKKIPLHELFPSAVNSAGEVALRADSVRFRRVPPSLPDDVAARIQAIVDVISSGAGIPLAAARSAVLNISAYESDFDLGAINQSSGARGIIQVLPSVEAELERTYEVDDISDEQRDCLYFFDLINFIFRQLGGDDLDSVRPPIHAILTGDHFNFRPANYRFEYNQAYYDSLSPSGNTKGCLVMTHRYGNDTSGWASHLGTLACRFPPLVPSLFNWWGTEEELINDIS